MNIIILQTVSLVFLKSFCNLFFESIIQELYFLFFICLQY